MSYPEIYMDDDPYASLNDPSQFEYKRVWSKKQKAIGVALFLLVLMVTAGVLIGICTRDGHSKNDVLTASSEPAFATTTVPIKTTETTDPNIGARFFVRTPQRILTYAEYAINGVESLTACLNMVNNAPSTVHHGFVCKSLLYFYNEKSCLLNSQSRETRPDRFKKEDEVKVDYFDVYRSPQNMSCPEGTRLSWIHELETGKGIEYLCITFNECNNTSASTPLHLRYHIQYFASTTDTKYFEEIVSLECAEIVTVMY